MYVEVIPKFDLDESLYEARQRCSWFIDGYGQHGLTSELFSQMTTEMLCETYNIDINFFKLKK